MQIRFHWCVACSQLKILDVMCCETENYRIMRNVLIHLGLQALFSFAFPFVERKHEIYQTVSLKFSWFAVVAFVNFVSLQNNCCI